MRDSNKTILPTGKKVPTALKISIIEPVGGHGGMHFYDFGLADGLAANGVDVTLFTSGETPSPGPHARFKLVRSFIGVWGRAHTLIRLAHYLSGTIRSILSSRMAGVEIVHFHFFAVTALELITVTLAKLAGLKVIITAHDVESFAGDHNQSLSRKVYRRVDRVVAHNDVSRRELIDKLQVMTDRISIIPHGNYLPWLGEPMSREQARRELDLPLDAPVLLLFGAIKPVKRLDLLLKAMPAVISNVPNVRLVVAGRAWKADGFARYQSLIDESNIRENVVVDLRSYIPDEDARKYYRAADLIVLPYERIYQSGVLLMAMSFAQPVLVSDIPGMLELVQDEVTGFTFQCGDADDLAVKLTKVLKDAKLRDLVAREGYRTVSELYDWKRIGAITAELYRRVLN